MTRKRDQNKKKDLIVCGICPDLHAPYEDKKAYALMLEVFKDIKIDELYILGDFLDFYNLNQHGPLDPRVVETFEDEIKDANEKLDYLDKLFKNQKKTYCVGNHTNRLQRFLVKNANQLIPFADVKDLLKMHGRPNWRWIPYGPNQKVSVGGSKLYARHEPTGNSPEKTIRRSMCSLVYGHLHRAHMSFAVDMHGNEHVAFSPGWLGNKNYDKIFGYVKNHHDWNLGFAIVYVDPITKNFYPQLIRILDNYTCVVNGKLYKYEKTK